MSTVFAIRKTLAIVEDGEVIQVITIVRDITKRKRMEEELLKAQKLESVGVLAGGLAHNLNNALTGILGNISLANMHAETIDVADKITEWLTKAEHSSEVAASLTKRLLTFAKGGEPVRQSASIENLLKDSSMLVGSNPNVRCILSIPDGLPNVEMDEGQMTQAISNMVSNAARSMPNGGEIRIEAEYVELTPENGIPLQVGQYVKMSIEDQGIGIAEEHIQKIFDPFFTTDESRTGLGLSAAYSIIKSHNGHITVEARVGSGTTFYIYLPAYIDEASEQMSITPMAADIEQERRVSGKGKILVMDDEEMIRHLSVEILNSIGYEAAIAADGDKAIELYTSAMESGKPFDAVILDLVVPIGMGGKETIQRLMEIDPKVKAIVSSGYSNDPVIANFGQYGFRDSVPKPYKIKELNDVLHNLMAE